MKRQPDYISQGTYATFEYYQNGNEFATEIMAVGKCDSTSTDREQIAYFISAYLPSRDYLASIETNHQAHEWVEAKDHWVRVASCFLEEIDNPILWDLAEGLITQENHDLILLIAQYYDTLWNLLHNRWELIKECLQVISSRIFNNPRELLQEILSEDADRAYLNCLKPYYQQNVRELRILFTLQRKVLREEPLSKAEVIKFTELTNKYTHNNLWLERTMAICQIGARLDPFIEVQIRIVDAIIEGSLKIQQGVMCKSSSYTWVESKKIHGIWSIRQLERERYKS